MKRAIGFAVLLVGFSLLGAESASAQWTAGVGASALLPVSDYGDYAKTGWGVAGTLGRALNENASFVTAVNYGSNDHDDFEGDKTNIIGVGGNIVYFFSEGTSPFVVGGVGVLGHQFKSDMFPDDEGTDWQGYVNGGGGLSFPLGGIGGYVLGNYVHGFDETTFISVGGGIVIPLGGAM